MLLFEKTQLSQELQKTFHFPPACSPEELFKKLAEKTRDRVATVCSLRVQVHKWHQMKKISVRRSK